MTVKIDTTSITDQIIELIQQNANLLQSIESNIKSFDTYLTIDEAASFAKLSTQTIHKHKSAIGYSQPDRKVIIKKSDLIAWIENFKTYKIG